MPKKKPLPLVDRDDLLLRVILVGIAGVAGVLAGNLILGGALRFWGPL